MSSDMRWRVYIDKLETAVRIGIHSHEKEPQRILVNAEIEGLYPVKPQSIEDCFNYDNFYELIVSEWPKRSHTDLLETLVVDVLSYIFQIDKRVEYAKVSISKPDIFKEAQSAGVEAEWKREDYQRFHEGK